MESSREGRHLAAVMFVDMVGYSALMQESEARAIAAINELWTLIRPILARHGGREVDLAGDGMLMEFTGVLAAARCSLDTFDALHKRNRAMAEGERIHVRAGLHLGDIEHRDGKLFGDGVNIAARLLPLAPPGCLVMGPHARDQLLNALDRPLESLGVKSLKNIKGPMELWCLAGPGARAADLAQARAAARQESADRVWRFGDVSFDERALELTIGGTLVEVEKKSLDILLFLMQHAGEVVTKEELQEAVWPGRILSESSLTTAVYKLRTALGEQGQEAIRTIHGYGYRFVAELKVETHAAVPQARLGFEEGDRPPSRPNWALVRSLGHGGHGEAWLARHDKTGEQRVFKFALDPTHLSSLKREITLSRLLHDGTGGDAPFVRVIDWNLEESPYFIECEYSPDGSLLDWAASRGGLSSVPLATRIELAAGIADALAQAHTRGVLHKDLKPGNVLVDASSGSPKVRLSDFGSGQVLDPERLAELGITRMGMTRTVVEAKDSGDASLLYLAPEIIAGQPWTSKADIYALGLILFQLVVGDFQRTLAPGWENAIEDELLREDIGAAANGDPGQRLGDAAALAGNLRSVPQRRERKRAEAQARSLAVQQQKKIERYKYRRWWTWSMTALLVLAVWGSLMAETDYLWSLNNAYSEIWDLSEKQEAAGNLAEAERLMRIIDWLEDKRVTGRFGWFALFEGPKMQFFAQARLAKLMWKQGQLRNADDGFRSLLAMGADAYGSDGRYMYALVRYAEFLEGTGRWPEAEGLLDKADDILRVNERRPKPWVYPLWDEDDYGVYGLEYQRKLAAQAEELRKRHPKP